MNINGKRGLLLPREWANYAEMGRSLTPDQQRGTIPTYPATQI